MLSTRDSPQNKRHIQTKSEGLEKNISRKQRPKKAAVAMLISDKIDFQIKAVKRDKEAHYIMNKGSIQEDITIININAPNIGSPQQVRQMLASMKGKGCKKIFHANRDQKKAGVAILISDKLDLKQRL